MAKTKKSLSILTKNTLATAEISTVFISTSQIKDLIEREGWQTNPDVDSYTAFICLNVWCCLFQDITGRSGELLATRIRLNGISYTITEADEFRISFIKEQPNEKSFWYRYLSPLGVSAESLTLVGYPRRMRIVGKDCTNEQEAFLIGNQKCKNHNLTTGGTHILGNEWRYKNYNSYQASEKYPTREDWLKTNTYTPGFILDEARRLWTILFSDWKQDTSLFVLPPGASCEGAHTYLKKFEIVAQQQNWLREHGVNIPVLPSDRFSEPVDYCRYNLVPKTFKSLRGIAPEAVSRQVLGYQVDSGMRKCLKQFGCDLSDQSRNREMSKDTYFASEDISAASDSISLFLVDSISIDTPELRKALLAVRSQRVVLNNQMVKNYRYATMGNVCTFSTEASIFLIACIISYELHSGKILKSKKAVIKFCKKYVGVYGDDCVLPSDLHEMFVQVCEWLGFLVNQDKSFYTGNFRESCGAEWFAGKDVTGTYWPRGLSKVPLAELVSMQHKLVTYPTANSFLIGVILDVFPEITQSEIGSPYQDIWCEHPLVRYKGKSQFAEIYYILEYYVELNAKSKLHWSGELPPLISNSAKLSLEKRIPKFVKTFRIWSSKPKDFGQTSFYLYPKWRRVVLPVEAPHDENLEVHTTITSTSTGKIPAEKRAQVEHLAYLLTIGGGIEHVNSSPYTKTEDTIRNRRDLVGKRKVKIVNKVYPV
jgi:hypothetical protein